MQRAAPRLLRLRAAPRLLHQRGQPRLLPQQQRRRPFSAHRESGRGCLGQQQPSSSCCAQWQLAAWMHPAWLQLSPWRGLLVR